MTVQQPGLDEVVFPVKYQVHSLSKLLGAALLQVAQLVDIV